MKFRRLIGMMTAVCLLTACGAGAGDGCCDQKRWKYTIAVGWFGFDRADIVIQIGEEEHNTNRTSDGSLKDYSRTYRRPAGLDVYLSIAIDPQGRVLSNKHGTSCLITVRNENDAIVPGGRETKAVNQPHKQHSTCQFVV